MVNVQVVKTQSPEVIYIRANGSIEGTDKIQRDGDIYTLTADLSAGIQVEKSYIIVDGAGYILQGDGEIYGPTDIRGMGLEIVECKNVTIKNLNIKKFTRGIRFTNSSDCNIYQNSLTNNTIWGTSGNNIAWNNITRNKRGVYVETSGINIIHHNNFVDNTNDWWDYGLTPWPFQLPFSVNIWDDGKEGNYWSKYGGTDNDSNGIGDTPHELYENNADNYPLMNPVAIPEFTEDESTTSTAEPFPTILVAVASGASVAIIGIALLVYFKKRRH
jgi:parallel beta-helix repeat protein